MIVVPFEVEPHDGRAGRCLDRAQAPEDSNAEPGAPD